MSNEPAAKPESLPTPTPPAQPYTIRDPHLTMVAKQLFAAFAYVPEGLREGAEMIARQLLPEIDRRLTSTPPTP